MTMHQSFDIKEYSEGCQAELMGLVSVLADPSHPAPDGPPAPEDVARMIWIMIDPENQDYRWNEEERHLIHTLLLHDSRGGVFLGQIVNVMENRANAEAVDTAIRGARDFIADVFIPAAMNITHSLPVEPDPQAPVAPCAVHGGVDCLCVWTPHDQTFPEPPVAEELRAKLKGLNIAKLKRTPLNTSAEFYVFRYGNGLVLAIGNTAYEWALARGTDKEIPKAVRSIPLVEQYRGQIRVVRRGDIKSRLTSGHPKSSGEIELVINANGNPDELTALFREITKRKKITVRPEISVPL